MSIDVLCCIGKDSDPSLLIGFPSLFRLSHASIQKLALICPWQYCQMFLKQQVNMSLDRFQWKLIWQVFFLMKDVCFSKIYGHFYLALFSVHQSKVNARDTCGLNCPGPGSQAATFITSSKLLCFKITLSFCLRFENFFVPRSVYFVRSNLPTPGVLCLVQNSSMRSMQVYFLVLRSTVLREAERCLCFKLPSTLYLEGQGLSLVSEAIQSKQHSLGLVTILNFCCLGLCLQSQKVRCSNCFLGSHQQ